MPADPKPLKVYGDVRGLKAPALRCVIPKEESDLAIVSRLSSVSIEQGPAIINIYHFRRDDVSRK